MLLLVYRVLSNFMRGLGYLAVVYLGARQVVNGEGGGVTGSAISLGLFQGTVVAFSRIGASSHELAMLWGSLQDVGVGFARVFQILRKPSDRIVAARRVQQGSAHPLSFAPSLRSDAGLRASQIWLCNRRHGPERHRS